MAVYTMARPVSVLELTAEEEAELNRRARAATASARDILRARIVLLRASGDEAGGRGARGGHLDDVGQQVVAAIRTTGTRRSGGPSGPGRQGGDSAGGGRGGGCQGRRGRARDASAQHAHDGERGWHLGVERRSHLARARSQAPPQAHLQAVERPAVRGQVPGCRGAVSGPAGEVDRAVLRREDADPGTGTLATGPAARHRPRSHRDARLRPARHDHAVRGDELPRRQADRSARSQTHACRVAALPSSRSTGRRRPG